MQKPRGQQPSAAARQPGKGDKHDSSSSEVWFVSFKNKNNKQIQQNCLNCKMLNWVRSTVFVVVTVLKLYYSLYLNKNNNENKKIIITISDNVQTRF